MYDIVIKMSASHIVLPFLLRTQLGGFVCHYTWFMMLLGPGKASYIFERGESILGPWGREIRVSNVLRAVPPRNVSEAWDEMFTERWDAFFISHWWQGWTTDQSMGWRRKWAQRTGKSSESTIQSWWCFVCVGGGRQARQSCKKTVSRGKGTVDTKWYQTYTSHLALGSNH